MILADTVACFLGLEIEGGLFMLSWRQRMIISLLSQPMCLIQRNGRRIS